MKFIDEAKITVGAGHGGPGAVSFRREAKVPRGGPDGGDGGKGGSVIFEVDPQLNSLLEFKYVRKYMAENGDPGRGRNMTGADGKDALIRVPAGTLIKDEDGNLIRDMGPEGRFEFLRGGLGGKGNTFFKTSVNQAPQKSQPGLPGEIRQIHLELKLIADVGLVGRPNAGKSTLISRISAAKPKVADYPFTTLVPNLGVVPYGEFQSFVVADIPGLIEGAHAGVGLGVQFLRHIERTKVFVHLVDVSEMAEKDPETAYDEIVQELRSYDEQRREDPNYLPLLKRPQLVVFNKIDACSDKALAQLRKKFMDRGIDVLTISAATGKGLEELIHRTAGIVLAKKEEDNA